MSQSIPNAALTGYRLTTSLFYHESHSLSRVQQLLSGNIPVSACAMNQHLYCNSTIMVCPSPDQHW